MSWAYPVTTSVHAMDPSDELAFKDTLQAINDFQRYVGVMSHLVHLEFDAPLGEGDGLLIEEWQEHTKHTFSGQEVLSKKSIVCLFHFIEVLKGSLLIGSTVTDKPIRLSENTKVYLSRTHPERDYLMTARFISQIGTALSLSISILRPN